MSISWITKQRLRFNPNYIYRVKREQVTDDVIDYVLSLPGLKVTFIQNFVMTFGDNEHLVQKILEREDFDNYAASLTANFDKLPKETVQRILDKMDENKTKLDLISINNETIRKYPALLKQYLRTEENVNNIKSLLYGMYIDTSICPKEDLQEIIDIYLEKTNDYKNINTFFFDNQAACEALLDHDFGGILKNGLLEGRYYLQDKAYENIRKYFLDHIDENIGSYYDVKKLLVGPVRKFDFTPEQMQIILEAAKKNNFVLSQWDDVLSRDTDLIINTIENATTQEEFDRIVLEDYKKNFRAEFTEEQKERLAQVLAHKISTFGTNGMDNFYNNLALFDSSITKRVIEINPYAMDFQRRARGWESVELSEETKDLPEGQYVPSYYTPINFFWHKPQLFMNYLRRHFDEAVSRYRFGNYALNIPDTEEAQRAIYEVALEHGYVLTKDSPDFLKKNPYLLYDAVQKGSIERDYNLENNLPDESRKILFDLFSRNNNQERSEEELLDYLMANNFYIGQGSSFPGLSYKEWKIIQSPKFIIRSLQENIYSALGYDEEGANVHFKELTLEDFRNIAEIYNQTDKTNIPPQILLRIEESPLFAQNPYILLEKYRNGQFLPKHSYEVPFSDEMHREIADLYIQRKGRGLRDFDTPLEKSNPYIIKYSIEQEPETIDLTNIEKANRDLEELIIDCLRDGRYKFSSNTPQWIKYNEAIQDYVINEGNLSLFKAFTYIPHFTQSQQQRIINRTLKQAENGDLSNLDLINFRQELSPEDSERITNIVLNATQDGSELGAFIRVPVSPEVIKRACFLNPNNIKYLEAQGLLSDKEFKDFIVDSIRTGRLTIDEKIPGFLADIPEVTEELYKNPSNLLVIDSNYFLNEDADKGLIKAIDEGTLVLPEKINYDNIEGLYLNTAQREKLYRYILEKRPEELQNVFFALRYGSSEELKQELTGRMLGAIRNGLIQVGDDFPFERITNDELLSEVIRQNPRLIPKANLYYSNSYFRPGPNSSELLKQMYGEDWFARTFRSRDEWEGFPTDQVLDGRELFFRVRNNPEEVKNISPLAVIEKRYPETFVKAAIDTNMILNENTNQFFRKNKEVILHSIELDPASSVYAVDDRKFTPEEEVTIKKFLTEAKPPVLLNKNTFGFLKKDSQYVRFSVERADESNIAEMAAVIRPEHLEIKDVTDKIWEFVEDGKLTLSDTKNTQLIAKMCEEHGIVDGVLQRDFAAIKYVKFDVRGFSKEEQEKIYGLFKQQEEELSQDPKIMELMMKNTFYMTEYVRAHPEEIPNLNFEGIPLTDEARTMIRDYYLQNNIEVGDSTPRFLKDDKQFVYQYIMQNGGELKGLSLDDVAPLLTFSEVKRHPEYKNLSKFYDDINLGYDVYIQKWGRDKTFEIGEQVGDLIKYMDPNKEPSIENLKRDFLVLLQNRSNLRADEVLEIITSLELELPENFFEVHNNLRDNDELFSYLIEKDPSQIRNYTGNNQELLGRAVDNGLELTEELFERNNFKTSDAIFKRVLEQKPELFKFYQGSSPETILLAYEKGYFSGKNPFELEEIFNSNAAYSRDSGLFDRLITEYGTDIGYRYNGTDDNVLLRLASEGFFTELSEEEAIKVLHDKANFGNSNKLIMQLLDKYSPAIMEEYRGTSNEVYEKAIQKGMKVDVGLFERRPELINVFALVEEGVRQDKYCNGLRISSLAINVEGNRNEIISIIKSIIGEEEYGQIVDSKEREDAISNLCTISDSPMVGISLLRSMDEEFIKELGFERWKQFVKYTFNNPSAKNILEIVNSGQIKEFMDAYNTLEGYYRDEQAYGINEILKFGELYKTNPELLRQLSQKAKQGQGLSEIEQTDLYMLLYSSDQQLKHAATIDDIGKLTEREAARRLERLDKAPKVAIKDDLVSFLLGMNEIEVNDLLTHDIDSQTLIRVINRAKKDSNKRLELDSKNLLVLVDLIEQFKNSDPSLEEIRKIARNVYTQDPNTLAQIRRSFANVREKVREFYEIEAQSELTNIQELMKHPEFVEKDGDDIIVDLSRTRHTLYGHVLGTSIPAFFNTDRGKVTICVSPVTDQHEAYYSNSDQTKLGFDTLPTGSFIGSAPENMGSNGRIKYNDYDTENVRTSFRQPGIRESYNDGGEANSGHGETLLYRNGLVPSCIILSGPNPTDQERKDRKELEEYINRGKSKDDPDYKVIPFVRTQRAQNRVFAYEQELPREMIETEVGTLQEQRVDDLRKLFSKVFGFNTNGMPRKNTRGQEYIVDGDEVFVLIDDYSPKEIGAMKAGQALQTLVYGEDSNIPMDIREFTDESRGFPQTHIGINDVNARSLWQYSRQNQKFSHTTNSILLKEFLVDHLLCNYQVGNTSYDLDTDEIIYGRNKREAGNAVDDFIGADGSIYTSMSYLYFDSEQGNNLYRKVFEDYISTENPDRVFTEQDFEEFIKTSDQISRMDDEEYLEMFSEMLDGIPNAEMREKTAKVLLERKKNIAKDSREFVDRIQNLRQIEQQTEVIDNPNSVAFINDIHGNLEALEALLAECERTGKKDIFVLGDMIGFGPQSNECLDLLRANSDKFNIRCVLGNHELYSIMGNKSFMGSTAGFQAETTAQIRSHMSPENRQFIESLPIARRVEIGGKKIELTHFPVKKEFKMDSKMYVGHGGGENAFGESASGEKQDAVIYGHEHRTESTMGDTIGTIGTTTIDGKDFINLPSSGCVHGKNTSFVTIGIKDGKIVPEVHAVSYERTRLEEALKTTNNPNAHFFGGFKEEEGGR